MPYPYTWTPTKLKPDTVSQVRVLTAADTAAELSTPISLTDGEIAFSLAFPGRYKIVIQKGTIRYTGIFDVDESGVDTDTPEQYEYTRTAPPLVDSIDQIPSIPVQYVAEDLSNPGLYHLIESGSTDRLVSVDAGFNLPSSVLAKILAEVSAGHNHTASQISDSTVTGRAVLTASNATAARAAIGAGTSNLTLGTTSSTAKPGDWVPLISDVVGPITKSHVGLPNVDNTSDANKPISTATQAALNAKITAFSDPNADRIVFWDDSVGAFAPLSVTGGLTLSDNILTVDSASETLPGRVELATSAETATGTDNTRAVHPAGLKPLLDAAQNYSRTNPSIDVKGYGVIGDGIVDDTVNAQAAITNAAGTPVRFGPGTYKVNKLTLPSNTTIILDPGAIIHHTTTGAVFEAAGTQSGTSTTVTVNTTVGVSTVTAPGHGLVEGDMFRISSNKVFDAFSTNSKVGEVCLVHEVAGDVITVVSPLAGIYTTSDAAYIKKITPVKNVRILGGGTIRGTKTGAMGQYGIDVRMGVDIFIQGIHTRNIDRRHIYFSDCINAWVENCTLEWAIDNTMAYGTSFANATRDSGARFNTFKNIRHAFTTNNETAWPGIPMRIAFQNNTVWRTSVALGGSMLGGDAIDTHSAAEEIWIEYNKVIGSAGQGINFECRSGRIIGNVIRSVDSGGISVHNEADFPGRITVIGNEVYKPAGVGIYVRAGVRGTIHPYEYINVSNNTVDEALTNGIVIGTTTSVIGTEKGITAIGNTVYRNVGTYAFRIANAEGINQEHNKAIGGVTTISITDSAPPPTGDHPGYIYRVIASDAITINGNTITVAVDTEGSASSDTLSTISGGLKGQILAIKTFANARDVTISTSGNIRTLSAFTLDAARDSIVLCFDGTNWIEQSRADFPAA